MCCVGPTLFIYLLLIKKNLLPPDNTSKNNKQNPFGTLKLLKKGIVTTNKED